MKRKNVTRNALFTSILSLLLCVSMLVGTTFAWFTDEVASGINQITAGNLDVELYNGLDNTAAKVKNDTELFGKIELWEPGVVAYENLTVANEGNLALKYQLAVNFENATPNPKVEGKTLADALKVGFVEGGIKSTTREEALAEVTTWEPMASFAQEGKLLPANYSGEAVEGASEVSETYGIIIYWQPGANDNDFNMNNGVTNELSIDLGVKLLATQLEAEKDSFGNDYDAGAKLPWDGSVDTTWYNETDTEFVITTPEQLAGLAELVNAGNGFKGKTVKLGDSMNLGNKEWTPIGQANWNGNSFKGTFDGNNKTISNLKVTGNESNVGLFGSTTDGAVKNLTVNNAQVSGYLNVGVVAGQPYTSEYSNITVNGHVEVDGFAYVGGVGGKNAYNDWTDITVSVDDTSYVKANSVDNGTAYRTYVGGVIGFSAEGNQTFKNVTSNIDVSGSTCDIGGIAGIAHYNNVFINCSSSGDVSVTNASEAADAEEMGGIAGVWHNQNGTSVTFDSCSYTGKLSANIDGVDLSDNTIVGSAYSATGTGVLKILVNGGKGVDSAASLADALAEGGKVILTGDVTVDANTNDTIVIPTGVTANLDMNGYDIVADTDVADNVAIFNVNGNLNITGNGTISLTNENGVWSNSYRYAPINVRENGNVTLDGGVKVVCEAGAAMAFAVDIYHSGVLTINDASLHSNYIAVRCFYETSANVAATVNVNGGSITSDKNNWGIWVQCTGEPHAVINVADGISYTVDTEFDIYTFN